MHARIDQLLSVLDREPVDATVHAHLERCASCSAQLQRLTQETLQLRELPQLEPPPHAWEQIAARLPETIQRRPHWSRRWATFAAIGVGAVGLTIGLREWSEPKLTAFTAQQPAPRVVVAAPDLRRLQEQSRELEAMLEDLPRPAVERVAMAATVDSIEQRVQWLDWLLSAPPDDPLNQEQTQSLWRERVTLMDSLVTLRYAESEPTSF